VSGAAAVAYRAASPTDGAGLAAFAARCFTETFGALYPPQDLADFLAASYGVEALGAQIADPGYRLCLALRGREIVGYCTSGPLKSVVAPEINAPEINAPEGARARELHRLYVDETVKGAGVAHALMEDALAWARGAGAAALYLSVWENNARAQRFYRGYGFEHVGEHAFMVGATRDRDFIWRLDLDAARAAITPDLPNRRSSEGIRFGGEER